MKTKSRPRARLATAGRAPPVSLMPGPAAAPMTMPPPGAGMMPPGAPPGGPGMPPGPGGPDLAALLAAMPPGLLKGPLQRKRGARGR